MLHPPDQKLGATTVCDAKKCVNYIFAAQQKKDAHMAAHQISFALPEAIMNRESVLVNIATVFLNEPACHCLAKFDSNDPGGVDMLLI